MSVATKVKNQGFSMVLYSKSKQIQTENVFFLVFACFFKAPAMLENCRALKIHSYSIWQYNFSYGHIKLYEGHDSLKKIHIREFYFVGKKFTNKFKSQP